VVEESYDGVKLGLSITKQFVNDMIVRFKDNKRIHKKYVFVPRDLNVADSISGLSNNKRNEKAAYGRTHHARIIGTKRTHFNDLWRYSWYLSLKSS